MKKRLIENLPAPRITKKMEGMVVIARNPAEGLLTLDVVETITKEVAVRICVTQKEFMNYYPEDGTWDQKYIDSIMTRIQAGRIIYYDLFGKTNIQKVLGKKYESILSVRAYEYELAQEKRFQAERQKIRRCRERNEKIPAPDKELDAWLKRYVGQMHYIYYRRDGKYVQVACSACGRNGRYIMMPETYEDHLKQCLGFKPEHNMGGEPCPMCGAYGKWKAAGKTKGVYAQQDRRYVVDKVNGTVVIRYFEIEKYIQGTEFYAKEDVNCTEKVRSWFEKKKVQKDYYKHNCYTGKNFWDDRNFGGFGCIQQRAGKVRLKEKDILNETMFQYSGLEQEIQQSDYTDAERYLTVYKRCPVLEMLGKLGMTKMKRAILEEWGGERLLDLAQKKPQDIFQITGQRFNDLREKNGDAALLSIYQYERKNNIRFKEQLVEKLYLVRADEQQITVIRQHAKLEKVLNYIIKLENIEKSGYLDKVSVQGTLRRYVDYLNMLSRNGRQFTEHELYPADFTAAHDREVTLLNQRKEKKEITEKNEKNPNIKKDAAKYNRNYRYQNKDYIICAPKDAAEIFMEGLKLNHCVGRMGYIEAMNRHETVILFLRKKTHKDVPYYTLEIKDGKLVQAYGYGDEKPDWEKVGPFLESFKEAKLGNTKNERKAG